MFIFFVEFICARSSSKFLWQWNDTLSNACPATYEVAMAKGHLMTSQTAVFANPFVTSQRALSDNPIDDVTDNLQYWMLGNPEAQHQEQHRA